MAKATSQFKVFRPKPNDKVGANITAFGTAAKPECVNGFVVGPKGFFQLGEPQKTFNKTWALRYRKLPKGRLDFYFFDISQPLVTLRRVKATGTGKAFKSGKKTTSVLNITYPLGNSNPNVGPPADFWADGTTTTNEQLNFCRMENTTDPSHFYDAMIISQPIGEDYWSAMFSITDIQNPYRLCVTDTSSGTDQQEPIYVQSPGTKKKKAAAKKKK